MSPRGQAGMIIDMMVEALQAIPETKAMMSKKYTLRRGIQCFEKLLDAVQEDGGPKSKDVLHEIAHIVRSNKGIT